ncbi:MAG: hypothetical protein IPP43_05290 [Chitinophagaceae bacterium]|nr:hypothetical protein [Chitinophagaceae bacterium]
MNKIKGLLLGSMLVFASMAFGQAEKTVSTMKAGTVLTDTDIGFLSMVANANLEAGNRGAPSATIGGKTYTVGYTLTAPDAKSISKEIKTWSKSYKAPEKSRAGLCYYWYYYCDYYGYCYYYKYWYYCY